MVDIEKATAEFREASERNMLPLLTSTVSVNALRPVRLCRGVPASTTGTLDSRPGKEDAFEQQIAGRWHNITLLEASEYVDQ